MEDMPSHGLDTRVSRRRRHWHQSRILTRVGMYQPFGGGSMDEGWTRWVLNKWLPYHAHNADVRTGALKDKCDAIILPNQGSQAMINGSTGANIRPEYSGGISTEGVNT